MKKISKKDISSIFKSDDVIIGAEFEFIAVFLEETRNKFDMCIDFYDHVTNAHDDYCKEREEWILNGGEDKPPEIPEELITYSEECYHQIDYSEYKDGDLIPEPLEPEEYDVGSVGEWVRIVERFLERSDWTLPFGKNYRVTSHNEVKRSDEWIIEDDPSLDEAGIEIKSPLLPIRKFVKICPKIFDWIERVGYTDERCGFHIHISLRNIPDLSQSLDIVKLILFTEEEYIYKFFPKRIDNQYAISMKKLLSLSDITSDDWEDFINTKWLESKVDKNHRNSINWEGLEDDKQHIEFRYIGGNDYHRKWDKIRKIISRYAYSLNMACNPEFHKVEYRRKIQRIINKLDMAMYRVLLGHIDYIEKNTHRKSKVDDIVLKRVKRKYENLYNNMIKIFGDSGIDELAKKIDIENIFSEEFNKEMRKVR